MKYSNPARRLHTLLSEGKAFPSKQACKQVWGELLEVDPNSPDLLRKLAKVMMLPEQIKVIVEKEMPSRVAIQKHWLNPVNNAFSNQNLMAGWESFIGHIGESAIDFLAMTSDLIEEKTNSDDISDSDIISIQKAFSDVQSQLLDSDLSTDFKRSLSRAIHKILAALDDYKISGSAELMEAIDSALGRAVRDENYRAEFAGSEVGNSFIGAVELAAAIVTVATGVPAISGPILTMISGG